MKKLAYALCAFFLFLNVIAALHAYKFTHFSLDTQERTEARSLTMGEKLIILFTGISNPKPANIKTPHVPYQHVVLNGRGKIDCWVLNRDAAKGTILVFHGFSGEKSGMIGKAEVLHQLGYRVMLVDFVGSGASSGNQVTLGYKEAEDIKACTDYWSAKGEQNIYLMGTSMGAAAILRAIHQHYVSPKGIIIECPFGTMYGAVAIRFKMMGIPAFPMAHLLMFWGGAENGFWAYGHNPEVYAKSVSCPALLMYGEKDDRVTRAETDAIYNNLAGPKQLLLFPEAGHEDYLKKYHNKWRESVGVFLSGINKRTAMKAAF